MWGEETLVICWGEYKPVQSQWNNSLGVPQKTGNGTTTQSCSSTLAYFQRNEIRVLKTRLYHYVHHSVIHNSQDMETTAVFLCGWMDEKWCDNAYCIYISYMCCASSLSHVRLSVTPWMDCSPPGPSVHRSLQARILEWVAMASSRGSSQPRDQTQVSCIAGGFFTVWAIREVHILYMQCIIYSVFV